MKIGVIEHVQNPLTARPQRYIKKSAAECLLRRLLAVRVSKSLIMMVPVRDTAQVLPAQRQIRAWRAKTYEHHIEPRLERLTLADSPWLRYLHGYA